MISGARYHLVATSASVSLTARNWLVPRLTLGHEPRLTLLGLDRSRLEPSGQTKVADLQLAVGIDQQVSGLEVPVQHVGRVDVLQTAQRLVDERLKVCVRQRLTGPDLPSGSAMNHFVGLVSLTMACKSASMSSS